MSDSVNATVAKPVNSRMVHRVGCYPGRSHPRAVKERPSHVRRRVPEVKTKT